MLAALAEYGKDNGTFDGRMKALALKKEAHFIGHPDQGKKGAINKLIERAGGLSIERHRIAHGIVTGLPSYDPATADADGVVRGVTRFWLGAPFYSVEKLRTVWVGPNAAQIDEVAAKFAELRVDILAFIERLEPAT